MYRCYRTARLIVAAAVMAAAAVASAPVGARAATVVLWACHGPSGQALGSSPFTSDSSGDGLTPSGGCTGTKGLEATFSRPDPLAGSIAAWQLPLPNGVTLQSVGLTRSTSGFGGSTPGSTAAPISGDSLIYSAATSPVPQPTSNYVLEQDSLGGPGQNVWLDGEGTFSPSIWGGYLRLQVMCKSGNEEDGAGNQRCGPPASAAVPGVDLSAVALTVSDATAPRLAMGGVQSPAAGTLQLYLKASDDGVGLARAQATIDGYAAGGMLLGGPDCTDLTAAGGTIDLSLNAVEDNSCPRSVVTTLPVNTKVITDGSHQLQVVVTDAAGLTSVFNQTIQIQNNPPKQTNTATIGVGSGASEGETNLGNNFGITPTCLSPKLTMKLADRPLRWAKHHIPVLRRGKGYLFKGKLTCLKNGRRVAPPKGTVVGIYASRGKRTRRLNGVTVVGGRVHEIVRFYKSRAIVFRYNSSDGSIVSFRLRFRLVRSPK